jgi:hypothetical protein
MGGEERIRREETVRLEGIGIDRGDGGQRGTE